MEVVKDNVGGGYSDYETIDFEGVVSGITKIRERVDTELSNEINTVGNLAEELVQAWYSAKSIKNREKIEDMKVELKKASDSLGLLVNEVEKYNIAIKNVDEGTR